MIDVAVDAAEATRVRGEAAALGLPVEFALYIAVEVDRAVNEAAAVAGLDRADLIAILDAAAADAPQRGPRHVLVRPLEEYAAAVDRGLPRVDAVDRPLRVRVPHRVAAAWAHAAAAAGVPFERWLADAARRASADRVSWEATAARTGRTLAEWVLLQAARCARSRSTSPQTTASD